MVGPSLDLLLRRQECGERYLGKQDVGNYRLEANYKLKGGMVYQGRLNNARGHSLRVL